jgi:hypothetical protein
MDQLYRTTVTTSVTVNPYLPAIPTIELIRRELCAHPVGALVETSVRQLARAIGRSAGQISDHLDRLEADGWIRRLADPAGTVIEVLRNDHPHDRSFTAPESDHVDDRFAQSDHVAPVLNPQPHPAERPPASDHADDPPLHPPIRYLHDSMQQQHGAYTRSDTTDQGPALNASEWQAIRSGSPSYSGADFERDLEKLATRDGINNPIGLIVRARSLGEPIYSQEELHARTPARAAASAPRRDTVARGRRDRRSAAAGRAANPSPVDYDALLAAIDAADAVGDDLSA